MPNTLVLCTIFKLIFCDPANNIFSFSIFVLIDGSFHVRMEFFLKSELYNQPKMMIVFEYIPFKVNKDEIFSQLPAFVFFFTILLTDLHELPTFC